LKKKFFFYLNKYFWYLIKGFSCRSSSYPRLLYGVKALFPKINNSWWHIYAIRNRNFGRKLIQSVLNSTISLKQDKTDIDVVSSEIFLIFGDYIIIECTQVSESNCRFLIYYQYKNIQYKYSDDNDYTCQNNNYPDLFKFGRFYFSYFIWFLYFFRLLPSIIIYETTPIPSQASTMDGTTSEFNKEFFFVFLVHFSFFSIFISLHVFIDYLDINYYWLYYHA